MPEVEETDRNPSEGYSCQRAAVSIEIIPEQKHFVSQAHSRQDSIDVQEFKNHHISDDAIMHQQMDRQDSEEQDDYSAVNTQREPIQEDS